MNVNTLSRFKLSFIFLLLSGCATFGFSKYTAMYGPAKPVDRVVSHVKSNNVDYWREVKPLLDSRCVVCHACYDAPCQLKLTAIEGVERGANHDSVYNLTRPFPAQPSRLFVDATSVEQWREKSFFPVLNEHQQEPVANADAGVMYKMLTLKKDNPLPVSDLLPTDFTLGVDRKHQCPKNEDFDAFAQKQPMWGMPYGLPAVGSNEHRVLSEWLVQGATYTARTALPKSIQNNIVAWEQFLNQSSLKAQLMSRYLYEHLFLAHLYFDGEQPFFKIVRSKTPPGQAVDIIATRRAYDDPQIDVFYYRLIPDFETTVVKTHLPYELNGERMQKWKAWFLTADYELKQLPSYLPHEAGNPFLTFSSIPVDSRYRFLLDESQFIIANFIKGPVCRGQVAVSVIRDHFWVVFVDPDVQKMEGLDKFLAENYQDFEMPNTEGDIYLPMTTWKRYADKQLSYLEKRDQFLKQVSPELAKRDMNLIWDGDGENANAGLTIFRHFDSASIEQGLLGGQPKTAWVMGYGLLERIYYLLAAGYDVYGNVGHQLLSRVYMDFLRMEGESNFLYFLPPENRIAERDDWYQGAEKRAHKYLNFPSLEELGTPFITFATAEPKVEFLHQIKLRLEPAFSHAAPLLVQDIDSGPLAVIKSWRGESVNVLAEFSILEVRRGKSYDYYSILKNNGHKNVSTMFKEHKNLAPQENSVSVLKGISGSYPNAFFSVDESELAIFSQHFVRLKSESDYLDFKAQYGIRRTSSQFWDFSDRLHTAFKVRAPIYAGILDYNRLENR